MILEGHTLSKFYVCGQEATVRALTEKLVKLAKNLKGDDWGHKSYSGEWLDCATGANDSLVLERLYEFDSQDEKDGFLKAAQSLVKKEAPDGSGIRVRFVNPPLPMVMKKKELAKA